MIRVLLVAPIPALRAGLRALLVDSNIEIVGEATRLDSVDLSRAEVDVLIYASASASSPDAASDSAKSTSLLILSNDPLNLAHTRQSDGRAWGILPLEASREELLAAIHALSEGLIVGAVPLMKKLMDSTESEPEFEELISPLSDREVEVLNLLSQGLPNKQIAGELGISEHTVKFHISSIYNKLNVTNRAEAMRRGLQSGLISL